MDLQCLQLCFIFQVILNLRFKTTRQTLCSDGSSMLAAMFAPGSSRAPGILTDGAFFLDRDPEVFKVTFLLCFFLHKETQMFYGFFDDNKKYII